MSNLKYRAIDLMSKVFTNGPRDRGSISRRIIPKTQKMVPDTALLNTEYYKVVIYKALCFDVAQGRMNGAPNETRTHSCRFASLAC